MRKFFKKIPFRKIGYGILGIMLLVAFIYLVWSAPNWTGFGLYGSDADPPRPKLLWDWLDLLIIPIVVGFGGWWLNQLTVNREAKRLAEEKKRRDKEAEEEVQRSAIRLFFDRIESLLTQHENDLLIDGKMSRAAARGRLRNILAIADPSRKKRVFEFLKETGLCDRTKTVTHQLR